MKNKQNKCPSSYSQHAKENTVKKNGDPSGWDDPSHRLSADFLGCVQAHKRNQTWLRSANVQPLQRETFFKFLETLPALTTKWVMEKNTTSLDNEAASNSYVKQALIHQSQTFVALQRLRLRHNTKCSLGWEVVWKINKAPKRRNYKHSAVKNEEKAL